MFRHCVHRNVPIVPILMSYSSNVLNVPILMSYSRNVPIVPILVSYSRNVPIVQILMSYSSFCITCSVYYEPLEQSRQPDIN